MDSKSSRAEFWSGAKERIPLQVARLVHLSPNTSLSFQSFSFLVFSFTVTALSLNSERAMIQKLNGRRGSSALAPQRESTSLDVDGPETWGSWYNRRSVLSLLPPTLTELAHVPFRLRLLVDFTLWKLSKNPFEHECVVLAIKYDNPKLTSTLPHP